ncbi:hypothetical protein MJH12_10135 [bacterium]|nr:hypothetical protein [bacterium]
MNFFYNLGKYSIHITNQHEAQFAKDKTPMPYEEASILAKEQASSKSKLLIRRLFRKMGVRMTSENDSSNLYE